MLQFDGIAIDILACEVSMHGVQIQAVGFRHKGQYLLNVLAQLLDCPRHAGIIASDGQAAAQLIATS